LGTVWCEDNLKIMKYKVIYITGIATQIGHSTEIKGYTVGVFYSHIPSNEEAEAMGNKACKEWIRENNKRMRAICKFLNENFV